MRYLNSLSTHPFYNDEQITADSGVKPVSSDIKGDSVVEEGFLTVTDLQESLCTTNYHVGSVQQNIH